MTLLVFYLTLALGVSFFCSIAEAVLLSVRPSYVEALEPKGSAGAAALVALRANLDRPLAAILSANTIAHTVGAAGVGAQSAAVFGSGYVGITSAILTLLILVFSEIIPKTLGATHWRRLAPTFGILINGLTRALLPLVWLSERITRLLATSGASAFTFSRDEMEAMAEIGAREGQLQAKELRIVRNLMRLRNLSVSDVMTPRPVIFAVPSAMTVRDFLEHHAEQPFSRIPLRGEGADEESAYVLRADLLLAQARGELETPLTAFARELPVIPDTSSASTAFDMLMLKKSHIAVVVDEYGSTRGLVSLEDIVETLIGLEITDELDRVADMQALAHQRWRERMQAIGVDPDSIERGRP
jgi:CBS domain containing-hemolysin-like protein